MKSERESNWIISNMFIPNARRSGPRAKKAGSMTAPTTILLTRKSDMYVERATKRS